MSFFVTNLFVYSSHGFVEHRSSDRFAVQNFDFGWVIRGLKRICNVGGDLSWNVRWDICEGVIVLVLLFVFVTFVFFFIVLWNGVVGFGFVILGIGYYGRFLIVFFLFYNFVFELVILEVFAITQIN